MDQYQIVLPDFGQEPAMAGHLVRKGAELFFHDGTKAREVQLAGTAVSFQDVTIEDTTPELIFIETGATADEGRFSIIADGDKLTFRTRNDADASGETWLEIDRTGTTVDNITFTNGDVIMNGRLTVTNAAPEIYITETGATANEGNWRIRANNDTLLFDTRNDADGSGSTWMIVSRSATSISKIQFGGDIDTTGRIKTGNQERISNAGAGTLINLTTTDTNGIDIGDGNAADQDLITVDEGTTDASRPRFWWDDSKDEFALTKGLEIQDMFTVTGASAKIEVNGQKVIDNNNIHFQSSETGITASTTQTQAGAQLVTKAVVEVATVANANDTIRLTDAPSVAGISRRMIIRNNGANTLQIFPAVGDAINGGAVDASITLAANTSIRLFSTDATNWYS